MAYVKFFTAGSWEDDAYSFLYQSPLETSDRYDYCIAPIFGGGFILALLADFTKGAKYRHCQYFTS
jgi:hypothetical protein